MNEKEKDSNDENVDKEREKLKDLGVSSTWNILTDLTKKKNKE
jgi:hypothetical protein